MPPRPLRRRTVIAPPDPIQAAPMMSELLVSKARPVLFARVLMRGDFADKLRFSFNRHMASFSRLLKPSQFRKRLNKFIAVDSKKIEYEVGFHSAGRHGFYLSGAGWEALCKENKFKRHDIMLIFMYKHNVIEGAPITAVHRLLVLKETGHEALDGGFCCEKCGTALLAANW